MTGLSSQGLTIAERRVHVVRGSKSQTVNVCTRANVRGDYEITYRLDPSVDTSGGELSALADLESLRSWALEHGGTPEQPGAGPGTRLPQRVAAPRADHEWLVAAREAVERALTAVVNEFCDAPYLHRVEHSIHIPLYDALRAEPLLSERYRLKSGGRTQLVHWETQLIHKEWPETVPGDDAVDGGPRGKFDIAVLSPRQVEVATLDQFRAGTIDAPIAIEVGLDYGFGHLQKDARKLLHSDVPLPYLLHMSRIRVKETERDRIEGLVTAPKPPLRAAYVHLDPETGALRVKGVNDAVVTVR